MKQIKFFVILLCFFSSTTFAGTTLRPFKASFNVLIFGTNIGSAKHQLTCQGKHCQLTSKASPPSWAQRFINESTVEVSDITQTPTDFQLDQYKKYLTRRYSDRTIHKTYTIKREPLHKDFHYLEKNKTWPLQNHAFDMISMTYAVQYLVINHRPLTDLYLQDDKIQQKIQFSEQKIPTEIDLDFPNKNSFFESNPSLQARRFHFSNQKADVTIWLLPKYHFFPGRISVLNKTENRKIVLELTHLQYQE